QQQGEAKYLIVGGYAVMKYTEPFTPENAQRIYDALLLFGAPMSDLTVRDLAQPRVVFKFGMVPTRLAILTAIDGPNLAKLGSSAFKVN
ncbi:MAG: hypothetical protein ABJF23_33650, partial [Bryobacteraceae bacterium]